MKIRNGFVSNSSSSSFVLIISESVTNKLTKIEQELIKELGSYEKVLGAPAFIIEGFYDCDYNWLEEYEYDKEFLESFNLNDAGELDELFYSLEEKLRKEFPEEIFYSCKDY
jgi:hypothetical protein